MTSATYNDKYSILSVCKILQTQQYIFSDLNLSLYLLYFVKACNEFATHLCDLVPRQHSYLRSGGKPFATLCKTWPAWELNSRPLTLTVRPSKSFFNIS